MLVRLKITSLSLRIRRDYLKSVRAFLARPKTKSSTRIFFLSAEWAVTICFVYCQELWLFLHINPFAWNYSSRELFFSFPSCVISCFLSSINLHFYLLFNFLCIVFLGYEPLPCLSHRLHLARRYRLDTASIRRTQIALSQPSHPLKPPRP